MSGFPNINALWADRLLATLAANGVARVVVSPGSRSTPLALAAHARPELTVSVLTDERSAAFFALGLARAHGAPVALVCTSGTAAVNYHPALVEAGLEGVPLVVLTADRPPRLRGLGAPQTIDQAKLYGATTKRFVELPMPEAASAALRAMSAQVAFACAAAASAPAGPVHLNVPFDDPLAPVPHDEPAVAALGLRPELGRALPRVAPAQARASDQAVAEAARLIASAERPLVIAGPTTGERAVAEALVAWAQAAGVPVVADVGANVRGRTRTGAIVCAHADVYLREGPLALAAPDLVIRLGGAPTAKGIQLYLQRHLPRVLALQPDAEGRDPEALAELVVVGEVADTLGRLEARADGASVAPGWAEAWAAAEAAVAQAIAEAPERLPAEAQAVRAAIGALGGAGVLCLSNSLSVRHADTYMGLGPDGLDVHVFRGANGIDGVTSMSLGIATAGRPTLLVTGDLAFLHDLGGLAAARDLTSSAVVLVLNNDGGGIFSYLPVAEAGAPFEPLFGTPHGQTFAQAAALFGLPYARATSAEAVGEAVALALQAPGLSVIEFPSTRAQTASDHRAWLQWVAARALAEARP